MCFGAIYWAGIKKVVYSSDRNHAAEAGFSDRDIYDEIALIPGKRRIKFVKLDNTGGEAVFRKWEEHEKRIQY
jgi:tRNA(Arg) A34 adenosine deaminase TadA